jgi:hypothetical protein
MSPIRALAFGDLDDGLWGAAWSASATEPLSVAVGAGSSGQVLTATLSSAGEGEEWRLEGDRIELVLTPSTQPAGEARSGALRGFDQLCRARGRVTLGDSEVEIDAPGWRGAWDGQLKLERIESFRQVAAWFGREDGLALVALRRGGARGQDADLIAASVLAPKPAPAIEDPRLSTTYGAAGVPTRAGVELWLAGHEAEDSGSEAEDSGREAEDSGGDGEHEALPPGADDEHETLPRRAAGEATAASLEWEAAGFALQAVPLRWHSRGEDGAGVYLLGRRA